MKLYPEVVTVRLPKGTIDRVKPLLAPGERPAEFWREKMLGWLETGKADASE
jgi:hypothetical protein